MAQIRPIVFKVTDPFPTVKIGNQTWMAQDLNIDDGGSGIVTVSEISFQEYGSTLAQWTNHKFYTRSAAMRIADTIPGWRLPTIEDYNTLVSNIGGSSNVGYLYESPWGSDSYGFGLASLTPGNIVSSNYKPTTSNYSNYNVDRYNSYATLVTSTFDEQMAQYIFASFIGQGQYYNYWGILASASGDFTINTACAQVRLIKDS